jgi:hypothetical protein
MCSLIQILGKSVELCMKTRTQMYRSTIQLRSRHNTFINLTSGERLDHLKLTVYFSKTRTLREFFKQPQITQYLLYEMFEVEQKASEMIKFKKKIIREYKCRYRT